MKVSIIIPTFNEEEYLPILLESIRKQDMDDYEIIVADADSTDKTVEIAKKYNAIVVKGGMPGVGRNNGAKIAKGELLIFLDSDLEMTEGYLKNTIKEFEEENLDIAITQMLPSNERSYYKILHKIANMFMIAVETIKPHGAGCYGIISKKSYHDKIGGFDESLSFGEDTDYIEKIGEKGSFKVLRKPKIIVSTRRLEEEGIKTLIKQYGKSTFNDFRGKRTTKEELDYNFGHNAKVDDFLDYYRKNKEDFIEDASKKRIIYSVCGEGMGHATRSAVIIEELKKDYEVLIFASERAYKYLHKKFDDVYEIYGFNTVYKDNKVQNIETFVTCMKSLPHDIKETMSLMTDIALEFKPNLIITDFEYYASGLSYILNIPMISVDNIHVLTKCKLDYPKKYITEKIISDGVIAVFLKKPEKYFITSFFNPEVKNPKKTKIYPPILRKEILELKGEYKDHILVYQTSDSNDKLIKTLKKFKNEKFLVYGFKKEEKDENIEFMNFNEDKFYEDIRNAKAVIANGGFTFITESLYLKKPIFSIPAMGNFEQIVNGLYVEKLNYGIMREEISYESLEYFINNLDNYKKELKSYETFKNNDLIIDDLKKIIDKCSVENKGNKTNKLKILEKAFDS